MRLSLGVFAVNRKGLMKYASFMGVFLFGLLKGYTMKPWTFSQDVVYFTLPYRLRVITSVGYVMGLFLRSLSVLVTNIKQGDSPTKILSKLLL